MKYWDRAWNPVQGCKKVSEGCDNCYAESLLKKKGICTDFCNVRINNQQLSKPFDREPELIFVCSQSDLFQNEVADVIIDGVLRKCSNCISKTFLILTKYADRMNQYFSHEGLIERLKGKHLKFDLDNIAFGVTVESNKYLNRIELLKNIPYINNKFVAFEPLLSSIEMGNHLEGINWVIVGCESGENARYCNPEWIENVIEEANKLNIPVFVNNVNWNGGVVSEFSELPKVFHRDENPFQIQ